MLVSIHLEDKVHVLIAQKVNIVYLKHHHLLTVHQDITVQQKQPHAQY
jgi:ACT domain-containing protein